MKKQIILLCLLMFALSFVSAEYLPHQQNTELNFSITSNFATSCELTTINSPSGIISIGQTDTSTGTFNFNIGSGNFSSLGTYCMNIVCTDGTEVTSGQECREVTPSGRSVSDSKMTANIVLFVFFLIIILTFYFLNRRIDYEKWYDSIIRKYEHKNHIKVILSSIGYNLMKNAFIWYYLFCLPLLLLVTDISYTFGVESMIEFLKIVLGIYYFGFILVGIFMFGYLQEWIVKLADDIKSWDMGVNE